MSNLIIFLIVIIFSIIALILLLYNRIVTLKNRVENGWAQIDVQLKRRYDLIPNLVETAKGYMKHEQETLEKVINARQQAIKISESGNIAEQGKVENFLTQTLRSLFALVENYPNLKADKNMLQLQEELTSTENRIAFARQYYNDEVMRYNTIIETFPGNIMGNLFNFIKKDFFDIEDISQRKPPEVRF